MSGPANRHARRAAAAKARAAERRQAVIGDALAVMAALDNPGLTGATLAMPDGETVFLPIATARAMKPELPH